MYVLNVPTLSFIFEPQRSFRPHTWTVNFRPTLRTLWRFTGIFFGFSSDLQAIAIEEKIFSVELNK